MPELSWKHEDRNGKLRLSIAAKPKRLGARIWVAQTASEDFPVANWTEQAANFSAERVTAQVLNRDVRRFCEY